MDSWRGARPNACRRRTRGSDRLLADRCLDPPTRSASPASLLSQPTVYPPIAAVWRIGKAQRHATPTPCNLAGSLMEIPMLNDLLEKVCQRFWFLPGRHSLSCQAGLREARPTRERRPGQLRPQRAMAQGVSRPDYCPRIGRDLRGDGVDGVGVLHRLAARTTKIPRRSPPRTAEVVAPNFHAMGPGSSARSFLWGAEFPPNCRTLPLPRR